MEEGGLAAGLVIKTNQLGPQNPPTKRETRPAPSPDTSTAHKLLSPYQRRWIRLAGRVTRPIFPG